MSLVDDLTPIPLEILNAGIVRVREMIFEPGGRFSKVAIPALFAVIEHPREGIGLFDTGYTPRFHSATDEWPFRLYRWATPVEVTPGETAVSQLAARGIDPHDVRWIILSHFDPDHYGGLADFPNARILCMQSAWDSVVGRTGWAALLRHVLPGHLPPDLPERLQRLPAFDGPCADPLGPTHDVFGDGTIRLVELPGHAIGQVGALIRNREGRLHLLAADATWTLGCVERACGGVHRWLAHDRSARNRSIDTLAAFLDARSDATLVPSHCPRTANALDVAWPGRTEGA